MGSFILDVGIIFSTIHFFVRDRFIIYLINPSSTSSPHLSLLTTCLLPPYKSGVPRAGLPRAHEVQDAVDPLPAMGRDPPPRPDEAAAQALQPDPIFFPNRTRGT